MEVIGRNEACLITLACVFAATSAVTAQEFDPNLLITPLEAGRAGPTVAALKSQNALNIIPEQPIPAAFDFPAASISIEFDGSSALLTANGIDALRSVAAALKDPRLSTQTFQIGSHLVSQDDPAGVQRVSSIRAQRVVEHLVAYYQLNPARLVPVGYGSSKVADPQNLYSPANTRVEIINVLR